MRLRRSPTANKASTRAANPADSAAPGAPAAHGAPPAGTILDAYVREAPTAQLAIDLFRGEWASLLPAEIDAHAGSIPLFIDPRVDWIVGQAGGVDGRQVLELGPLEAGHTYMLERAGAFVTAVEANTRAYMKCLIVKELVQLQRSRFLLGDYLPYMEATDRRFDLTMASGVLYHAPDPLRLLRAIARVSDRVGIWTHYYDPAITGPESAHARVFVEPPYTAGVAGVEVSLHPRHYLEALQLQGFCGGSAPSAAWMELEGIVDVLRGLGFTEVEIGETDLAHAHGPCVLLYAQR
ncbi:MAG: methyltransferase domain-containing protein [Actinomycetota bacterium]